MLHPLIIAIVTVNTSLTVAYWTFLLGDAYFKWLAEPEDKPKKVVTPAWWSHSQYGPTWLNDLVLFCIELVQLVVLSVEFDFALFHLEKTCIANFIF